jgi:hypothetical protein
MESFHPVDLAGIKRLAHIIKREQGIQQARALDAAAQAGGYRNFKHAQNILPSAAPAELDDIEVRIRRLMVLAKGGTRNIPRLRRRIAQVILEALPILQARDTYWAKLNLVSACQEFNRNEVVAAGSWPADSWLLSSLISLEHALLPKGSYNENYTPKDPKIADMPFEVLANLVMKELLPHALRLPKHRIMSAPPFKGSDMQNADELKGYGSLQAIAGGPSTSVRYHFIVTRFSRPTHPGLPPPPPRMDGRGKVLAIDGSTIEEGLYNLTLADGRTMRLQHLAPDWHIVAGA